MPVSLRNDPCACPAGLCAAFCDPPSHCINRLTGEVVTRHCEVCDPGGAGSSWHQDGRCLRCAWLAAESAPAEQHGDQHGGGPDQGRGDAHQRRQT